MPPRTKKPKDLFPPALPLGPTDSAGLPITPNPPSFGGGGGGSNLFPPAFDFPAPAAPTTPQPNAPTTPPTSTGNQEFINSLTKSVYGDRPVSDAERAKLLYAYTQGNGNIKGFFDFTEQDNAAVQADVEAQRAQQARDEAVSGLGIGEAEANLQNQINNPQNLQPSGLGEQPPTLINSLLGGNLLPLDSLRNTTFGKGLTTAAGITGIATLAYLGIPAVLTGVASTTIAGLTSSIGGGIKTAATAAGGIFLGGKITNVKGSEIKNLRAGLAKIPGQSSTILSAVQSGGLSAEEGFALLQQLAEDVTIVENRIKQIGIYNIQYRASKEYLAVTQELRDARLNILERLGGIETILRTGRPQLQPDQLLYKLLETQE